MKLKELRELLGTTYDKMSGILKKADGENRSMSDEEKTEYDSLKKTYNETRDQIKVLEEQEEREREVSEIRRTYTPPVDHSTQPEVTDGERRDLSKYSLVKALRNKLDGKPLEGIEKEMHEEGEKEQRAAGVSAGGNLIIPQVVLAASDNEKRDMTATGGTDGDEGGKMIQQSVGSIIGRTRSKLVLRKAGVRMIGGLEGNISWPVFQEDDAAAERSENAAAAESSPTLGSIETSPNRLPVFVEFSRQFVLQTSPDIESMLRDDLAFQIAKVMDTRGINGSGTGNQPRGILQTPGIGAVVGGVNGAAPTWDHIVNLETAVAVEDADEGKLGYLTNAAVKGKLKRTFVDASSNAERVWDKDSKGTPLNENPAHITNLVPSNLDKGTSVDVCSALLYGNFGDAMMNQWGGLEFLVNPYSRDTEGLIRLNAWTFYDFLVRRAKSFAAMLDALTD